MDLGYKFLLECMSFDPTQEAPEELVKKYYDMCESGISKQEEKLLSSIISRRFDHIIEENEPGLKTKGTDNDLLLISWKYLSSEYSTELAVKIIKAQLESTLCSTLTSLGIPNTKDNKEEYLSCVYNVLINQMPMYDPSKGVLVTYLAPYIKGEIFRTLSLANDRSIYDSLRYRDVCSAIRGLAAEGFQSPTEKEISTYINDRPHKYQSISPRVVSNIMQRCKITAELDENIVAEDSDPEEIVINNEENSDSRRMVNKLDELFEDEIAIYKCIWKTIVEYFESTSATQMPSTNCIWTRFSKAYPEYRISFPTFKGRMETVIDKSRELIKNNGELPQKLEAPFWEISFEETIGLVPPTPIPEDLLERHAAYCAQFGEYESYEDLIKPKEQPKEPEQISLWDDFRSMSYAYC